MKRILIATDFFYPQIGGAERQVQLLGTALAAGGADVTIATVRQPGQPAVETVDAVPVRRLTALAASLPVAGSSLGHRFIPPIPDPQLSLALRRLVDETRADVVHANGWIAYSCAAALEGTRVALVLSVRDYGYSCAVRSLLWHDREVCDGPSLGKCLDCAGHRYGALKAVAAVGGVFSGRPLLKRRVRGIHSVSRYVQTMVQRDLLRGDWQPRLERIPDIVPEPATEAVSASDQTFLARLPLEPFILFVGVLQPHKGILVLLDAYQRLRDQADGADSDLRVPPLVLIGSTHPETPHSFPEGTSVFHDVPHSAVMAAWQRCLFGVAPSLWPDPLPGVVREPMTRGRPVVGSESGGIPDMVEDGVNGLLVPAGDAVALAAAMRRMTVDTAARDRMGRAALAGMAAFSSSVVADSFDRFYDSVLT